MIRLLVERLSDEELLEIYNSNSIEISSGLFELVTDEVLKRGLIT